MNHIRLLLIDDDVDVYNTFKQAINPLVAIDFAENMTKARTFLKRNTYQLIVLDVNLEDENGLEILEFDKVDGSFSPQKVLIITADKDMDLEIKGHNLGVREYLKKPLNVKLLRSILDKHFLQILEEPLNVLRVGPFFLDNSKFSAEIEDQGQNRNIKLTQKEFHILKLFLGNKGIVFSRDSIFEKVWNEESESMSRTVDMHISSLKKKISPHSEKIKNKRGFGYFFEL